MNIKQPYSSTLTEEQTRAVNSEQALINGVRDDVKKMIESLEEFSFMGLINNESFSICKQALERDTRLEIAGVPYKWYGTRPFDLIETDCL